jgi:hypothetical protein
VHSHQRPVLDSRLAAMVELVAEHANLVARSLTFKNRQRERNPVNA